LVIDGFEWDEANTEHISRHGLAPDEVEEIFSEVVKSGARETGDILLLVKALMAA